MATKKNIGNLLKKYPSFKRVASNIDDEKLTELEGKEDNHSKNIYLICCLYHDINVALDKLNSEEYSFIYDKYLSGEKVTAYQIHREMSISADNYYRHLNAALFNFCKSFREGLLFVTE